MSKQPVTSHHSDLGPSSKDWQPGSPGRDEDYTPEKDLWAQTHGEAGKGGAEKPPARQERKREEKLDEQIEESFPASDPPASTDPATGWDLGKGKKT